MLSKRNIDNARIRDAYFYKDKVELVLWDAKMYDDDGHLTFNYDELRNP